MVPKIIIYDKNEGPRVVEDKSYTIIDKAEIKSTLESIRIFMENEDYELAQGNIQSIYQYAPKKLIPREAFELENAIHELKRNKYWNQGIAA